MSSWAGPTVDKGEMSKRKHTFPKPGDIVRLRSGRGPYNAVDVHRREWYDVTPGKLGLVLTVGPGLYSGEAASGTLLMEGQVISVSLDAFSRVRGHRDE